MTCENVFGSPAAPADCDDAWAIAWAISNPHLDVLGIVVSFGNCACVVEGTDCGHLGPSDADDVPCDTLDEQVVGVEDLVASLGADIPVFRGSARRFRLSGEAPLGTTHAAAVIVAHDHPVSIIGIGPASDPAYLVRDVGAHLERVYLEMGQYGEWAGHAGFVINGVPVGDYNFRGDPGSVVWVVADETERPPLTFVPFNAIVEGMVSSAGLDVLAASRPAVAAACEPWLEHWTSIFHEGGFHLWDVVCSLAVDGRAEFTTASVTAEVVCIDDKPSLQLSPTDRVGDVTVASAFVGFNGLSLGGSAPNTIVQLGLGAWLPSCHGDLTGDGRVDGADLGILLNLWGSCR